MKKTAITTIAISLLAAGTSFASVHSVSVSDINDIAKKYDVGVDGTTIWANTKDGIRNPVGTIDSEGNVKIQTKNGTLVDTEIKAKQVVDGSGNKTSHITTSSGGVVIGLDRYNEVLEVNGSAVVSGKTVKVKTDNDEVFVSVHQELPNNDLPEMSLKDRAIRASEYVENRLNKHEQDLVKLRGEFIDFKAQAEQRFNDLDNRLDATNASLHAVTNARPMVANGQTAFGVGTGFAGSAQAVSIGAAHSFADSGWSVSATVNQTTGSYSEFSGGAGVQFAF